MSETQTNSQSPSPKKYRQMQQIKQLISAQLIEKTKRSLIAKRSTQNNELHQWSKKTQLQKFLSLDFQLRTQKIVKSIKNLLKDFQCFTIKEHQRVQTYENENNFSSEKNSFSIQMHKKRQNQNLNYPLTNQITLQPQLQSNKHSQVDEIVKRDLISLILIFSLYSTVQYYHKGEIIDLTAEKRQQIRILVKGDIAIFQPTNKTSLQNSMKKQKHYFVKNLVKRCNQVVLNVHKRQTQKDMHDSFQQSQATYSIKPEIIKSIISERRKLTSEECEKILHQCQVISLITPHKHTKTISNQGILLSNSWQPSIFLQFQRHQTSFSSISMSEQAILMQLDFSIYKEIMWILNNNSQKQYLSCLLKKFQNLTYYDAKKFLRKQGSVIDHSRTQDIVKIKVQTNNLNQKLKQDRPLRNEEDCEYRTAIKDQKSQQELSEDSSDGESGKEQDQTKKIPFTQSFEPENTSRHFELPYTKSPYLIVQGQVSLVISKTKQYSVTHNKHATPKKVFIRQQLIKLYQNDIFGIEQIGEQPEYQLRYQVKSHSKILKMDFPILKKMLKVNPKFKKEFLQIKHARDQIIYQILGKMAQRIEKQMIKTIWNRHTQKYKAIEVDNPQSLKIQEENEQKQQDEEQQSSLLLTLKDGINTQIHHNNVNIYEGEAQQYQEDSEPKILKQRSFSLPQISLFSKNRSASLQMKRQSDENITKSPVVIPQISNSIARRKIQVHEVQFIGKRSLYDIEKEVIRKIQAKDQKRFFTTNSKTLTVELLKEFRLVDFKQGIQNSTTNKNNPSSTYVEMRDPVTGLLLRRKSIPSIQEITDSKNRKKLQNMIMRKIGLLSQAEKVKHNQKVVTSRKSDIKYQNQDEKERKQFKRLYKISKSVPRLQNFYSKKADIQYKSQNKKKFLM